MEYEDYIVKKDCEKLCTCASKDYSDLHDELVCKIAEDDDLYLTKLINSKYSKIELLNVKSNYIEIRGTVEVDPNKIRIVELKNIYPNSEITVTNHK